MKQTAICNGLSFCCCRSASTIAFYSFLWLARVPATKHTKATCVYDYFIFIAQTICSFATIWLAIFVEHENKQRAFRATPWIKCKQSIKYDVIVHLSHYWVVKFTTIKIVLTKFDAVPSHDVQLYGRSSIFVVCDRKMDQHDLFEFTFGGHQSSDENTGSRHLSILSSRHRK